ncbi:MAG TPA: SGNH/GDSL hydrolase family protein [Candidatus Limnocylindrales bacterium]|nr:SGNH/GDSL hydrolase family protein [Candidatus Limnocylindrales bacterium]
MSLRYVALGDSYTIGISVTRNEAWPSRLVATLEPGADGRARLELVANLASNGRTSADVLDDQLPRLESLRPEFVSLLIGVNDVVQGVRTEVYRANVTRILDDLTNRLRQDRLLVVTTPDYTVTPAGADFGDPDRQRARIVELNAILAELATARGIAVVDIFDLSSAAERDRSLVARDGLHPSAHQYDLWIERIGPVVGRLFSTGTG